MYFLLTTTSCMWSDLPSFIVVVFWRPIYSRSLIPYSCDSIQLYGYNSIRFTMLWPNPTFITNSFYFMIRHFQCTKITETEKTRNRANNLTIPTTVLRHFFLCWCKKKPQQFIMLALIVCRIIIISIIRIIVVNSNGALSVGKVAKHM